MAADAAPCHGIVAEARLSPAREARAWLACRAEAFAIPIGAAAAGLALFSLFLPGLGHSPATFLDLVYRSGLGSPFAFQNSLQRAAPILVAALCVALPARIGRVIIGSEGAIVLGGLAAAAAQPLSGAPAGAAIPPMALAAALAGPSGSQRWRLGAPIAASTIASLSMSRGRDDAAPNPPAPVRAAGISAPCRWRSSAIRRRRCGGAACRGRAARGTRR